MAKYRITSTLCRSRFVVTVFFLGILIFLVHGAKFFDVYSERIKDRKDLSPNMGNSHRPQVRYQSRSSSLRSRYQPSSNNQKFPVNDNNDNDEEDEDREEDRQSRKQSYDQNNERVKSQWREQEKPEEERESRKQSYDHNNERVKSQWRGQEREQDRPEEERESRKQSYDHNNERVKSQWREQEREQDRPEEERESRKQSYDHNNERVKSQWREQEREQEKPEEERESRKQSYDHNNERVKSHWREQEREQDKSHHDNRYFDEQLERQNHYHQQHKHSDDEQWEKEQREERENVKRDRVDKWERVQHQLQSTYGEKHRMNTPSQIDNTGSVMNPEEKHRNYNTGSMVNHSYNKTRDSAKSIFGKIGNLTRNLAERTKADIVDRVGEKFNRSVPEWMSGQKIVDSIRNNSVVKTIGNYVGEKMGNTPKQHDESKQVDVSNRSSVSSSTNQYRGPDWKYGSQRSEMKPSVQQSASSYRTRGSYYTTKQYNKGTNSDYIRSQMARSKVSERQRVRKKQLRQHCSYFMGENVYSEPSGRDHIPGHREGKLEERYGWIEKAKNLSATAKSHILVDDHNQIIYCSVPKVASVNIRAKLVTMSGFRPQNMQEFIANKTLLSNTELLRSYGLRQLSEYSTEAAAHRIRTYYSFMFVRDPLKRLYANYRDLLAQETPENKAFRDRYINLILNNKLGNEINEHKENQENRPIREDRNYTRHNAMTIAERHRDANVTFSDFLRYLTVTPPGEYDEHWMNYNALCAPCTIKYRFIGKLETMETDMSALVERISSNRWFPLPRSGRKDNLSLDEVSGDLRRQIIKIYRQDFKMFSYHGLGGSPPRRFNPTVNPIHENPQRQIDYPRHMRTSTPVN